MELQINNEFAKHYNNYRAKEEAAKTKKTLKSQIKQLEESSSSSDSEYEECYKKKYIDQCDSILRKIENLGKVTSKLHGPLYEDIVVDVTKEKIDKPVYAKDLMTQIMLDGGRDNEKDSKDIEKYSKLDSEDILNLVNTDGLKLDFDNSKVSDDEEFFKPSKKPKMILRQPIEKQDIEEVESEIESADEEQEPKGPISSKIEINRDRRLDTVRVSKTTSRAEKRKMRKEKKDKELKDKMKRLRELKHANLEEKLEKIKKNAPEMAKYLTIEDLDGDFDVDDYSKKLAAIYEMESADLPVDEHKPVFSDDSDVDLDAGAAEEELSDASEDSGLMNGAKKCVTKGVAKDVVKEKRAVSAKKNAPYFTKIDLPEDEQKKVGILRKTNDGFDRDKYRNYNSYFKKAFDICCEDLILGKDDEDDIKCRFHYRKVEEQTFGLDIEDIILADNKELNSWASLKKITRIRTAADEERDRRKYGNDEVLQKKREVLASLYRPEEEVEEEDDEKVDDDKQDSGTGQGSRSKSSRKRLRKLETKRQLREAIGGSVNDSDADAAQPLQKKAKHDPVEEAEPNKKSKKHKKQESGADTIEKAQEPMEDGQMTAINKKSKKHIKQESVADTIEKAQEPMEDGQMTAINKKSKKHKKQDSVADTIEKAQEPMEVDGMSNKKSKKHKKEKTDESGVTESVDNCHLAENKKEKQRNNEAVGTDDLRQQKANHKTKKSKKTKSNSNKTPVFNANRLESLGIKQGYYKYEMCAKSE